MLLLKKLPSPNIKNVPPELLEQVSLNLSEDDHMYKGNDSHYLSVGASALSVIESARGLAFAHQVDNILDFGIGAGRVARWLRAAFPQAQIEGSDIRAKDLVFCQEAFGIKPWLTTVDIR